MRFVRKVLSFCGVLLFWLAVWQAAALAVSGLPSFTGDVGADLRALLTSSKELLLPGPYVVIRRWFALAGTGVFWKSSALSLWRIALGVLAATALGIIISALCTRFSRLRTLLDPAVTVVKSTPVASFIILALIWIGRDSVPTWIAGLIVFPVIYGNLCTGFSSADPQLLEMAAVFSLSPLTRIRRVYLPAARPYFFSALRLSLGMAWKAGIAAEVLAVPRQAIGRYLYESKLYLETVDLFAWTLTVILLSLLLEKAVMQILKRWGGAA